MNVDTFWRSSLIGSVTNEALSLSGRRTVGRRRGRTEGSHGATHDSEGSCAEWVIPVERLLNRRSLHVRRAPRFPPH
jgi:hypothetical protein